MGATTTGTVPGRSPARLVSLAVAGTLVVVLVLVVPPWLSVLVPQRLVRQATMCCAAGDRRGGVRCGGPCRGGRGIVLGRAVVRRRRRREPVPPLAAKFLLLAVSRCCSLRSWPRASRWRAPRGTGGPPRSRPEAQRCGCLTCRRRPRGRSREEPGAVPDSHRRDRRIEPRGFPPDRLSIGTIVAWQLRQALPRRRMTVNVLARAHDAGAGVHAGTLPG